MSSTVDEQKIARIMEKIVKTINRSGLNVGELVLLYGNLGYHFGASIAGFDSRGPSLDELQREYYRNPTVDVGLMITGLHVSSWLEDLEKKPKLSTFREANLEKGNK